MTKQVVALDPQVYRRHPIHGEGRVWAETNCYVDIWIELAHALGYEPKAALPFTFAIDFEGDHWTFFKFPLEDLYDLFGLHVQELLIWRSLATHLEEQIGQARPVLVELDSFHLPDTVGTAYKTAHVKTTIAAVEIDVPGKTLGYFHGQGYHRLSGDDFVNALRLQEPQNPAMLPPYAEFVKIRERPNGNGSDLLERSLKVLKRHLALAPSTNPFISFKARLEKDLAALLQESIDTFHQYSFATLRQCGACYELSAMYLDWLASQGEEGVEELAVAFLGLAEAAKTFQFQLARAMARRRALDLSPLDAMAEQWERGISGIRTRYQ
jgi:hypothetical protein